MSPQQLKKQFAFLMANTVWGVAPGDLVYTGGVAISEDLEGNFGNGWFMRDGPVKKSAPFARVSCLGITNDTEILGRIQSARFQLWSTAGGGGGRFRGDTRADAYDTHGINMETGALRDAVDGAGKSIGRPVDELWTRFLETIDGQFVDSIHGCQAFAGTAERMATVDGVQVLKRALNIDVRNATISDQYHEPLEAMVIPGAAGHAVVSWLNPPLRFDTDRNMVRRGTDPSDPAPESIADGTEIALGGPLVETVTDSGLAPGIYNYSVFHIYSELGVEYPSPPTVANPVTVT